MMWTGRPLRKAHESFPHATRIHVPVDDLVVVVVEARCRTTGTAAAGPGRWRRRRCLAPRACAPAAAPAVPCRRRSAWTPAPPRARSRSVRCREMGLPLDLERTDEPSGALVLLQGEQPQRVAHEDRDAGRLRVTQPPQEDRDADDPEVCLGLATTGGEPQEICDLVGRDARRRPDRERLVRMKAIWNGTPARRRGRRWIAPIPPCRWCS